MAAGGIFAGQRGDSVDERQREPFRAGQLEKCGDGVVSGESEGVIGEVVARDGAAVARDPVEVGGEGDQCLVDVVAADSGVAAQAGSNTSMVLMAMSSSCWVWSSSVDGGESKDFVVECCDGVAGSAADTDDGGRCGSGPVAVPEENQSGFAGDVRSVHVDAPGLGIP